MKPCLNCQIIFDDYNKKYPQFPNKFCSFECADDFKKKREKLERLENPVEAIQCQ